MKKIDLATWGGLLLGLFSIFGAFVLEGGQFAALLLIPAIITVVGGTFAATIIGTSVANVKTLFQLVGKVMAPPTYNVKGAIEELVHYSSIARREGLLTLDAQLSKIRDPFMRRILRSAVDGAEPESLREVGMAEMNGLSDRHAYGALLFQKMGGYSPTMGIIGTVMGLITTLASAGDNPDQLIRHIASAFIATLWGVFLANIVWIPISEKLKFIHEQEYLYREIILDGVMGIQAGEIPSVLRTKLNSKLPPQERGSEN
ncbi:MAG TPA: MotA/TolQ/ExbB proton channel family protein [Bacteroidota bacterium]|nr:MotA/TolQ/ExbB proton channel family protein [Bacteroidota bacterium]